MIKDFLSFIFWPNFEQLAIFSRLWSFSVYKGFLVQNSIKNIFFFFSYDDKLLLIFSAYTYIFSHFVVFFKYFEGEVVQLHFGWFFYHLYRSLYKQDKTLHKHENRHLKSVGKQTKWSCVTSFLKFSESMIKIVQTYGISVKKE